MVSKDGKTMTTTSKGTGANGKAFTALAVKELCVQPGTTQSIVRLMQSAARTLGIVKPLVLKLGNPLPVVATRVAGLGAADLLIKCGDRELPGPVAEDIRS
jgi:hypothetical protein